MINFFKCNKSVIKDEQYFDKAGFQYMKFYLDFFHCPVVDEPIISSSDSFMDVFRQELVVRRSPSYEEIESWNESHGPQKYKGGLYEFVVDDGIKKIGKRAFGYNMNLRSIILPKSLKQIGDEAFLNCNSLYCVELPERIRKIGKHVFEDSLEKLIIHAKNPPKISDLGISERCRILIPKESKNLYLSSRRWKKYISQIDIIEDEDS